MKSLIIYHIIAFFIGIILDLILGDPHGLPHPVCYIGRLIEKIESGHRKRAKSDRELLHYGRLLLFWVTFITFICSFALLIVSYLINPVCGILIEAIMTWQILAMKALRVESMKVYSALNDKGIKEARLAVSMIVGRDTDRLDEKGVIKATVETIAENSSDGVIAPMLYLGFGGPILGFLYKAINTMDSMVGYKNDRYLYYGRAAAKADDFVNFLPARLSALFMILACKLFYKEYDYKNAYRICKRDRYKHASPNSAWTESVCAGALGIRLAGDAYYFGELYEKPYIGDDLREIERQDIVRTNKLMYISSLLFALFMLALLIIVFCI